MWHNVRPSFTKNVIFLDFAASSMIEKSHIAYNYISCFILDAVINDDV